MTVKFKHIKLYDVHRSSTFTTSLWQQSILLFWEVIKYFLRLRRLRAAQTYDSETHCLTVHIVFAYWFVI